MKNFTIKDNTVSAVNQVINSSELYYLGEKQNNSLKVLIVGNSITRHGPKSDIGWENDWGMAASSPEYDYVHLFYNKMRREGYNPYFMVRQAAYWETNFTVENVLEKYSEDKNFNADLLVFNLGENIHDVTVKNYDIFKKTLNEFVNYLTTEHTKCVFLTCFWENPLVDKAIKEIAIPRGNVVEINDLGANAEMRADGLFWHGGVAGHPGDKGMAIIAERIFMLVKKGLTNEL